MRLGNSIWEPFGTHFETAASKNRVDKRFVALLCQSFFESVSRSVPNGFLEEIVESRRRPMCV